MIDETQTADKLNSTPPQPWEFRSKPAWQRLLIMLGGIIVNVVLAYLIYVMILVVWGQSKILNSSIKNGIVCSDSVMLKNGFKNGDKILEVDGKTVQYFDEIPKMILFSGKATTVVVERSGKIEKIQLPVDLISQLLSKKTNRRGLVEIRLPSIVGKFSKMDTSYGKKAGLKYLDKIIAVDSTPVAYFDEIRAYILAKKPQSLILSVLRKSDTIKLNAKLGKDYTLGLAGLTLKEYEKLGLLKIEDKKYTFFEALPGSFKLAVTKLGDYYNNFKLLFKPETGAYKGIGGFASMGSVFSGQWDWESFWNITAFFSLALAFMNLLPIPVLDGGHVLFLLYEMITGREPNKKFFEYAQVVGMIMVFGLLIYANGNDLWRWLSGRF